MGRVTYKRLLTYYFRMCRRLHYHATGSNIYGQWFGCNDKIIQEFKSLNNVVMSGFEFDMKHATLVHIGWSHNIYHCNGHFYVTGDYKLLGEYIERLKLPGECVHSSDITITADDLYIILFDKANDTIWVINLETRETKPFYLSAEVPIKNQAKKNKSTHHIVRCVATNNIKLFLTSEGLVYSGLPPTLVDTSECVGLPVDIQCGNEHCVLLTDAGKVFTWGQGRRLQLGHGDASSLDYPTLVAALDGIQVKKIAAGGWHTLALSNLGDIYVWGWNDAGQLGIKEKANDDYSSCAIPTWVDLDVHADGTREANPCIDIACGSKHSAILMSDNTIWTCGNNRYGQLGFPRDSQCVKQFKKSHYLKNAESIKCGQWSTVAYCEEKL